MTANLMLAAWAILWIKLIDVTHGFREPLDYVTCAALVIFPVLCVLAARHLP